jgi:succinoglycan biosynthesis transport protein ExoP
MDLKNGELNKYYKMLVKRRYLFLAVSLFVLSLVAWGSFFLPKQYEASSTVFIEKNIIKDLVKGITFTPSVEDKIRVLKYAMLSRVFVTKVIQDIDQDVKTNNEKELEAMIQEFQKKTQISVKGNDLFIVTYRNKDPKVAMDYINTLVRKYVEENVTNKREESYGANRFLTEQLKTLKVKMDKSEDEIIAFRQQKGVVIAIDEREVVDEIKGYQTELSTLQIKRNELTAIRDSLKRQLKTEERFSVAVMSSKRPEGVSNEITALEKKVKHLLVNYTENYPEVIRLKSLILALKNQKPGSGGDDVAVGSEPELSTLNPIFQGLKQQLFQVESELEALNARQKQLRVTISRKEWELRNIPEDKKKLGDLQEERDATKQIHDQLMLRQGQAELSKQMEVEDKATTFRIVDPAIMPKKPVSPDRVKMILLGIIAGMAAGFGVVFLLETFDSSVKDIQSLRTFGIEVLAVIPTMSNEVEQTRVKKKDRLVYLTSASYFALICLLLVHELMGFTFIETIIAKLGLDKFMSV